MTCKMTINFECLDTIKNEWLSRAFKKENSEIDCVWSGAVCRSYHASGDRCEPEYHLKSKNPIIPMDAL